MTMPIALVIIFEEQVIAEVVVGPTVVSVIVVATEVVGTVTPEGGVPALHER